MFRMYFKRFIGRQIMEKDPLRDLKEKMVIFVTQCIDERVSKFNAVIDYENCQYDTEHFVKHEPNKSAKRMANNGTYKMVEE